MYICGDNTMAMNLEERIRHRYREAVTRFELLEDGDNILVGVSGGKDSLCLLELLAAQARIYKPRITVQALHVRMENIHYETDTTWLDGFCQSLGIRLHVRTTRFDKPVAGQTEKPPCFLCSWMRRKMLFRVAQELGCNKIALGHHQDDILHTALMNLLSQGRFSSMPVSMRMQKMPLTIIRPLCMEHEDDIVAIAASHHYEQQLKQCPYEQSTMRNTTRAMLNDMQEHYPEARYSIWKALERDGKLVEK